MEPEPEAEPTPSEVNAAADADESGAAVGEAGAADTPAAGAEAEAAAESGSEASPPPGGQADLSDGDGVRMEGPPGESGPERRARIARQMAEKRAKKEAAAEAERERQQLIDHFLIISAKVAGMGGSVAAGDTCCCVSPAPVLEEFGADSDTVVELAIGDEIEVLEVKAIDGDSRQLQVVGARLDEPSLGDRDTAGEEDRPRK